MRRLLVFLGLILPIFSAGLAQAPTDEQRVLDLVKQVQTQEAQIADNQAKIDEKMATLAETIRVGRIFAGRIGK